MHERTASGNCHRKTGTALECTLKSVRPPPGIMEPLPRDAVGPVACAGNPLEPQIATKVEEQNVNGLRHAV